MDSKDKGFLSEKQEQVYDMFYNQGIKQIDISHRLGITKQAVSKLIKKANKKKSSASNNHRGLTFEGMDTHRGLTKFSNNWRVEALNFSIKPYYLFSKYHKIRLETGNHSIPHKDWRIFLYKDSVRVQLKEGSFFRDPDKHKAIRASEESFDRFLKFASERYGFAYEKEGKVSISCNNMELEREDSKFAEGYIKKSGENFLQVRDNNGKVCFFIDQSKSNEHGYKGKDSFSHSENLEPYIEDFLYNNPLNNSQITSRIGDIVTALEKMTEVIKSIQEERR